MKSSSTIENLAGLARKINIQVTAKGVSDEFNAAYNSVRKNAQIKGFRKGKAPLETIITLYGDQVKQDVLENLVNRSYSEALQEHSLIPVSQPKINVKDLENNKEFAFSAEIEVRPEIKIGDYKSLAVEKKKVTVDEKEIEKNLKNIQQSNVSYEAITEDRAAQNKDTTLIDFDGYVDDKPLEGGKAEGHRLTLGSNSFIEGFEEAIVGMKKGEAKEIKLSFPEEYHNKEIAGKPVLFKVIVQEIQKEILPELNDELAKKLGMDNIDSLKNAVQQELKSSQEAQINEDLKKDILKKLIALNEFEVPQSIVQEQVQTLMKDMETKLRQQGMQDGEFEEYKKKWDKDFQETALFMVKSSFLIGELSQELKLSATNEDLDKKFNELAIQYQMPADQIKGFYNQPDQISNLKFQIMEDKVMKHLIDSVQIKEV